MLYEDRSLRWVATQLLLLGNRLRQAVLIHFRLPTSERQPLLAS